MQKKPLQETKGLEMLQKTPLRGNVGTEVPWFEKGRFLGEKKRPCEATHHTGAPCFEKTSCLCVIVSRFRQENSRFFYVLLLTWGHYWITFGYIGGHFGNVRC